jgi:hypothetical protein
MPRDERRPRDKGKDPAAVALGRRGGQARAQGLSKKRRKEIAKMEQKMTAIFAALMVIATAPALAEPLPQPKPPGPGGSCPHGYFSSGSFCVPSQGAQDAIPKPANGTCPFGWTSSGSYCLRSGSSR